MIRGKKKQLHSAKRTGAARQLLLAAVLLLAVLLMAAGCGESGPDTSSGPVQEESSAASETSPALPVSIPEEENASASTNIDGTTLAAEQIRLSDSLVLDLKIVEYEDGRRTVLQDFSFLDMTGMYALYEAAYENCRAVRSDVLDSSTLTIHFISRLCTTVYNPENGSEIVYANDEYAQIHYEAPEWLLTDAVKVSDAQSDDPMVEIYQKAWESFCAGNPEYFR